MMVLVTYDVNTETAAGRKRLAQVAKQCQNYGQRVQNSVFECIIDPALFVQLKKTIAQIIDVDKDSVRYYLIGDEWRNHVEHIGAKKSIDIEGILLT